jgi:hypothetical protein
VGEQGTNRVLPEFGWEVIFTVVLFLVGIATAKGNKQFGLIPAGNAEEGERPRKGLIAPGVMV